jgi:site-specific DNA recombinase
MAYYSNELISRLKGMKFFVYLRKSSEDNEDRQIRSIPGQKTDIEEQLVNKFGLNVIKPYYEESQTAHKKGRPNFQDMLQRLDKGEADGVISWHANRLARNYGDGGDLVQLIAEEKIKVVLTCYGFYENNPRDKEYLMTEFTRATRDSDDKSEAVKRGNRTKFFERQQWIGPAKIGYLNTTNPVTREKEVIEDPERFPILVKAISLLLSGLYTPMQVLDKINNEWSFRTRTTKRQGGKPLSKSAWYKFLTDPFMYGLMVRKEGEVLGSHKPMTTQIEFEKIQIMLGRKGKPHRTKHEFSYKEVLNCGECDASITAEEKWQIICSACKTKFHKGKKDDRCKACGLLIEKMIKPTILQYIHYHCTRKVNKNCTQGSVEIRELERQIDQELDKFEIRPEFLQWALEHISELNEKEVNDRVLSKNNAQKALQSVETQLDNLMTLFISPNNTNQSLLSEGELTKRRTPLLDQKKDLIKVINELEKRQDEWHELAINTFNFARYARYWFKHGDVKTKTQILGALGSNLRILDKILRVDELNSYFIIAEGKQEVEELAQKLEPAKEIDFTAKTLHLEQLRQCWLRGSV